MAKKKILDSFELSRQSISPDGMGHNGEVWLYPCGLTIRPFVSGKKVWEIPMDAVKQFLCDERAATAIEYAMIGALISIAIVGGARAIGVAIQNKFYGPIATNLS